jgi:uncharacterized protein (DUF1499 family)
MLHALLKPLLTLALAFMLTIVSGFYTVAIGQPVTPSPLLHPSSASLPLAWLSLAGTRPTNLGWQNGKFTACATTPNCVNSQATDTTHKIEPIRYSTMPEAAWSALKQTIQQTPKTSIVTATPDYLYVEYTSKRMGFVDDVEFYLNREAGVIEVRSASRLGESDLGVNRNRIEAIRTAAFNAHGQVSTP